MEAALSTAAAGLLDLPVASITETTTAMATTAPTDVPTIRPVRFFFGGGGGANGG